MIGTTATTITAEDKRKKAEKYKSSGKKQGSIDTTFKYTNETFSGCDMVASVTMNTKILDPGTNSWKVKTYTEVLGELTTISYSIHMEKKPIRSIGNVNAKDYVMGPRTIAGSLVFSVFNKHFAQNLMDSLGYPAGSAFLVDELPPFDITISAANEYGYRSRLAIYGIRLLNEGQVMSVNDVYTENTYQFFATDLEYLTAEMLYTRDETSKLYKLKDSISTNSYIDNRILSNSFLITPDINNYEKFINKSIRLTSIEKQPTRENALGIIDFALNPAQDEGNFIITNSKGKVTIAALEASEKNRSRKLSISLPSETYTVYFENTRNKLTSNKVKIKINTFYVKSDLLKYTPIIEKVTESEIFVYVNEPSHDKVKILSISDESSIEYIYNVNRRRCTINNLNQSSTYSICTCNEKDNLDSKSVLVQTLNTKDKLFNELTTFCYSNAKYFVFSNMIIYKELLEEAKLIAIKYNFTASDSLLNLKKKYIEMLTQLDDSLEDANLKENYDLKVKACNEIITFANKLNNDFIKAVNIDPVIPSPTMELNDKYENIFTFNESVIKAEFYKDYGNTVQFYYEVPKYNFKNIDGVNNSFKFNGKPGQKHYVEAVVGQARSPKLEFYVMTQTEKDELIKKDKDNNNLSEKEINIINNQINKDDIKIEQTAEYRRAFMINAKKITNAVFFPPEIETIHENIIVKTSIKDIINKNNINSFYLSVASYEDIIKNNPIYKVKFTNIEEVIVITRLFHGLKENVEYAIWIESEKNVQLSNVSTFIYSEDFILEDDNMKEYELSDITTRVNLIAKNTLPKDIYDNVLAVTENNKTITNYNYIKEILIAVTRTVSNKSTLINFLKAFKYYIGINIDSDDSMLSNISYKNGMCSFDSTSYGTILIYDITPESCMSYSNSLSDSNNVNTSSCKDLVLLIAINSDINSKSNLIIINRVENYMEVL